MASTKKYDKCPQCSPNGKWAIFHLEYNFDVENTDPNYQYWQCQNCNATKPYTKRVRKEGISESQKKRIEYLKRAIFEHDAFNDSEKYEIKDFKADYESAQSLVFFTITTGRKNDANTMASIFCRNTRLIMIKKNGGCELLNAKKKSESKGVWNCVHALVER